MSDTTVTPALEREEVLRLCRAAKAAAPAIANLNTAKKNAVLLAAAQALIAAEEDLLAANAQDVAVARDNGTPAGLIDRLSLNRERIRDFAEGLKQVADLADPVGRVVDGSTLPNGIALSKVRVPLGVMGMVYEARPNVTVDAFGLALKSGNVALLRGSKSAAHSNAAIVEVLRRTLVAAGVPADAVILLPSNTHESVRDLVTARGLVDVVIPRGGAGLIEAVVTQATVPAIETGTGNCHVFVHSAANIDMAVGIVLNGKTRRVSVCNATETLLIDKNLPKPHQERLVTELTQAGVTIHGDPEDLALIGVADCVPAEESDWRDEYLSMDIAVKRVDGLDEAIEHIGRFSSGHTDAIVTDQLEAANEFTRRVDSAAVMVNASTAFTDGGQYGMGAEIGISTQKLHARGPMGLPELTTTKWILVGNGQTRP